MALYLLLNDVIIPLMGASAGGEPEEKTETTTTETTKTEEATMEPTVLPAAGTLRPVAETTLLGPRSLLEGVSIDDSGFKLKLDVQQFKPEEIRVSTNDEGGILTVEGKHEEQQGDYGFISRHFQRRYILPEDLDMDRAEVCLSKDGQLRISAPKIDQPFERVIPIKFTNAPALQSFGHCPISIM